MSLYGAVLAGSLTLSAFAQGLADRVPKFEDYPANELFKRKPVAPILKTPEERKFQSVIAEGVTRGWGVFDGATQMETGQPGPNFAGRYILVHFGCGSPVLVNCIMAAIVDAKTGLLYSLPSPLPGSGSTMPHFAIYSAVLRTHPPYSFHGTVEAGSPLEYRLTSRLLIANICEGNEARGGSAIYFDATGCGLHFYLMEETGLSLIHRVLR